METVIKWFILQMVPKPSHIVCSLLINNDSAIRVENRNLRFPRICLCQTEWPHKPRQTPENFQHRRLFRYPCYIYSKTVCVVV